jgi:hypothetical protein
MCIYIIILTRGPNLFYECTCSIIGAIRRSCTTLAGVPTGIHGLLGFLVFGRLADRRLRSTPTTVSKMIYLTMHPTEDTTIKHMINKKEITRGPVPKVFQCITCNRMYIIVCMYIDTIIWLCGTASHEKAQTQSNIIWSCIHVYI